MGGLSPISPGSHFEGVTRVLYLSLIQLPLSGTHLRAPNRDVKRVRCDLSRGRAMHRHGANYLLQREAARFREPLQRIAEVAHNPACLECAEARRLTQEALSLRTPLLDDWAV